MMANEQQLSRKAEYGFDSVYVLLLLWGWAAVLIVIAAFTLAATDSWLAIPVLAGGLFALVSGVSFVYTTRRGKFRLRICNWSPRTERTRSS